MPNKGLKCEKLQGGLLKKAFFCRFRKYIRMDHKKKVSYSNNQSLVRFYDKLDLNRLFIF